MKYFVKNTFLGFLICVCAVPNYLKAQSLTEQSDLGNWLIYIGSKKLNQNWNWHHEVQYRNYSNNIEDLEQLLLRTGLGYTFSNKNQNLLLGYAYILFPGYTLDVRNERGEILEPSYKIIDFEHRVFQQFILKQRINHLKLSHRFRFEQRQFASQFKMRFRYFLSARLPFKNVNENKFYFSWYNELFLGYTFDQQLYSGFFDRNRLYGGLGYEISEGINLELGYLNQFFGSSSRDQLNLIMFLNL